MDSVIKRRLLTEIFSLLERKEIFAIIGPRQAGKTTLLKMVIDHLEKKKGIPQERIFYFTFEDPLVLTEFEKDPKEFIESRLTFAKTYFFLDEFHYAKEGGTKLKLVFDLFPQAKIFVSGSSSLELTFATAKYLAGRIFYFRLFPLSFGEFLEFRAPDLFKSFSKRQSWLFGFLSGKEEEMPKVSIFEERFRGLWEEFITFGGYPEVVKEENPLVKIKILENIVSTYLQREIRDLLLIEDLGGYQNLLRLLASQTGELVNLNQLSSDLGFAFPLLKRSLKVLEETFVIKAVTPFYRNLSSELRKTPKIYFLDHGLRNLLLGNFGSPFLRPDKGRLGEMFVFQEIFKRSTPAGKINFWRTRGGAEVDFVLSEGENTFPLEVKSGRLQQASVPRSLANFLAEYKRERAVIFNLNLGQLLKKEGKQFLFWPIWYG